MSEKFHDPFSAIRFETFFFEVRPGSFNFYYPIWIHTKLCVAFRQSVFGGWKFHKRFPR